MQNRDSSPNWIQLEEVVTYPAAASYNVTRAQAAQRWMESYNCLTAVNRHWFLLKRVHNLNQTQQVDNSKQVKQCYHTFF